MTDSGPAAPDAELRLAELLAALSLATDLGMGQPMESVLLATVLAVRLASLCDVDDNELSDLYYVALLRFVGCNADAHIAAETFGDELLARGHFAEADFGRPTSVLATLVRHLGASEPPLVRARMLMTALTNMPRLYGTAVAHCEVGQLLADRLDLGPNVHQALFEVFERWDGRGMPRRLKGEAVTFAARVVPLANDAVVYYRLGGVAAARTMVRQRSGGAYDPRLVERFLAEADRLFLDFGATSTWDLALDSEPGRQPRLSPRQLEAALRAMADFVDLKSTSTLGHSTGVAHLAETAAQRAHLSADEVTALRHAALVHDLGRTGVSSSVWEKTGPLDYREWERVRLHPYYTERVLARSGRLSAMGRLGALHHERLDGSGYHRAATTAQLPSTARILAAADAYQALTESRPHRAARSADEAGAVLRTEASAGRLDADAVAAVLGAAGHEARPVRRTYPAGLTEREVDVLRLVARGLGDRQIAQHLSVSERTAHHDVEHIFAKLGVSTRAAAAFFAMQHDLVGPQIG